MNLQPFSGTVHIDMVHPLTAPSGSGPLSSPPPSIYLSLPISASSTPHIRTDRRLLSAIWELYIREGRSKLRFCPPRTLVMDAFPLP